jgi:predicted amidohydrolase
MAEKLNVALVQASLIWENPQKNRSFFSSVLEGISSDVDLIILPEMFTSGFTMHPENLDSEEGQKTIVWMQKWASAKNAAITGSIVFHIDGSFSNRLFFVHPNGKKEQYDKRHTFTLAGENEVYKAGAEKVIIDYRSFKICPMICYDLRFPVWARNTEDYDVLFYVANWPKPRISAWDTLLKARAIENMAYCIGVNRIGGDVVGHEYPGHSGVYDGLGEQLAFSQKEEVLYATLNKNHLTSIREKLRFLEDRDTFTLEG